MLAMQLLQLAVAQPLQAVCVCALRRVVRGVRVRQGVQWGVRARARARAQQRAAHLFQTLGAVREIWCSLLHFGALALWRFGNLCRKTGAALRARSLAPRPGLSSRRHRPRLTLGRERARAHGAG